MSANKNNWIKMGARPADVQQSIQYAMGAYEFARAFDISDIDNQIYIYNGNTTEFFFDKKDEKKAREAFKEKFENPEFINSYFDQVLAEGKKALRKISELSDKIDSSNIKETHLEMERIMAEFYPFAWSLWLARVFEETLREKLQGAGFDSSDAVLSMLAFPKLKTPILECDEKITEIAQLIGNSMTEEAKSLAVKTSRDFGWMGVYNHLDEPYTKAHYMNEAKKLVGKSNLEFIKKQKVKEREENINFFADYVEGIKDEVLRNQLVLYNKIVYLREKREEFRNRLVINNKTIYEFEAKQIHLELKDVILLSTEEILDCLEGNIDLVKIKIECAKRRKSFVVLFSEGQVKVSAGLGAYNELIKESEGSKTKGQIAYHSTERVIGPARIVLSNADVEKVKDGDILISSMTKPDFLPAMKKAVAFVTDEGGLLCHASIVSREMKKPCIIGTKIATKIFKDGDIVEVDAERGVVTKISAKGGSA